MVEPILEVEHLRKVFEPRRGRPAVVDDVSFAVPPGGSLAIVGESGAGKTTIARMLLALETPTRGRIRLAGHEQDGGPLSAAGPSGWCCPATMSMAAAPMTSG